MPLSLLSMVVVSTDLKPGMHLDFADFHLKQHNLPISVLKLIKGFFVLLELKKVMPMQEITISKSSAK